MASSAAGHRLVVVDGYEILIGKGARDNDALTFGVGAPRDLWLHAAGYAGSHAIVRAPEGVEEFPREVVQRAAELAAWHSKARDARGKVEVHVCRIADVKKPRGFPPGQVQLREWRSMKVYPRGRDAS